MISNIQKIQSIVNKFNKDIECIGYPQYYDGDEFVINADPCSFEINDGEDTDAYESEKNDILFEELSKAIYDIDPYSLEDLFGECILTFLKNGTIMMRKYEH